MEHFGTLAMLIRAHRDKYNEKKRLYREMRKLEWLPWNRYTDKYNVSASNSNTSSPNYFINKHGIEDIENVLKFKNDISDYRKWCRAAAKYRRLHREAKQLLDGIRAVGKVCGTKVQTRSDDGFSFNKPFFIEIEGIKMPIKDFLNHQMFEEMFFKGK